MEVHLLGPVEAVVDGRRLALGATKQRAVLAILALQANATVPVERIIDGLWGDAPPASAAKMVQLYVSQLRRLLAGTDAVIVTHGRGYELRLAEGAVDVACFEELVRQASEDENAAEEHARQALGLWHGVALADVAGEPFAATEIRRLEDLHLRASELLVDADLAAGREDQALARLERLIDAHPLRERLHEQRMLALYRCGRQSEALAAYRAARQRLVGDVGVEPGVALRDLHDRVLRQDPSLLRTTRAHADRGPPPAPPATTGLLSVPRSVTAHPRAALLAAAALLALVAAAFMLRAGGDDGLDAIAEGAVGEIDVGGDRVVAQYRVGPEPRAVIGGGGSIWVASPVTGTVARIRGDRRHVDTIDVGSRPTALAFAAGSLWVAREDGAVAQVDPAENRVVRAVAAGNGLRALAAGDGVLWVAAALDGELVEIDLRSGHVTHRVAVGGQPAAVAVSRGAVWVAAEDAGQVARIDPRSGQVLDAIDVGNGPTALAVGHGGVWTANREDATVSRIDPASDHVTMTVRAGRDPSSLAIAGGAVWIGDRGGRLLRLDPHSGAVREPVRIRGAPVALATADGHLWLTAAPPPEAHRGRTLRLGMPPVDLDPAIGGYDPAATGLLQLAYEPLVAYRHAAGPAGAQLVGALAVDVPEAPHGARSYAFRVRRGLRYSDGTLLRASDVRSSLERMLALGGTDLPPLYDAIVGAARCRTAPQRCDLSRGVVADDVAATVTIRLRRPDPDLLQKLSLPLAAIVPANTPRRPAAGRPPPGTGPYRVASVVPGRSAELVRNPRVRHGGADGPAPGFADRITVTMGGAATTVRGVERGRLDLAPVADVSAARLDAIRTRVGARVRSGAYAQTVYAFLNVHAPPFDDVRVRQAVNLAVDRRRVSNALGGPFASSPTCQLLPPGMPGYRPVCPFTVAPAPSGGWTAPDVERARRLVQASGRQGTPVQVWVWRAWRAAGEEVVRTLRRLGLPAELRAFRELGALGAAAGNPHAHPQLGITGWIADFPEPAGFLRALVSCSADPRRTPGGVNYSRFCDRGIDRAVDRAQAAGAAGTGAWRGIEARIAGAAPVVPLLTGRWPVIASSRVGNLQFHPLTGPLLDQVWVR